MEKLGEAIIYVDTDSYFYYDDGRNSVKTGSLLGEWTDELGEGVFIQTFIATAPKSYYYIANTGKEVTKVEGFSLNFKTSQKINGEILEKIIDREIGHVKVDKHRIQRDNIRKELIKTFSFNFDKRCLSEDFDTFPYGF